VSAPVDSHQLEPRRRDARSLEYERGLPKGLRSFSIQFDANFVRGATPMLDIHRDIDSLSNFKRNTSDFIR
jgi:hypothetical protein